MSENYSIVLTGEIADGFTLEQVKANIGKLFKLSDAKVSGLFTGKPVVIRRGVDKQQAIKLKEALNRAGAGVGVKKVRPLAEPAPEVNKSVVAVENQEQQIKALNCPRCGHEQPYSNACSLCKMDFTLQLQRLQRKEKMRLFRQQAK